MGKAGIRGWGGSGTGVWGQSRSLKGEPEGKPANASSLSYGQGSPTGVASGQDAAAESRLRGCGCERDPGDRGHVAAAHGSWGLGRLVQGTFSGLVNLMEHLPSAPTRLGL